MLAGFNGLAPGVMPQIGWGGWIRTNVCQDQNLVPSRLATPQNLLCQSDIDLPAGPDGRMTHPFHGAARIVSKLLQAVEQRGSVEPSSHEPI